MRKINLISLVFVVNLLHSCDALSQKPQEIFIQKTQLCSLPKTFKPNVIDLPTSVKPLTGKVPGNSNYYYKISEAGEIEIQDEVFDKYNFSVGLDPNAKEFGFSDILGVWVIESSSDKAALTVPVKGDKPGKLNCAKLFLISKDQAKPLLIDSMACNFTNAPFALKDNSQLVLYIKDKLLCAYSVKEKVNRTIGILHMPVEYQSLFLKIEKVVDSDIELTFTFNNLKTNQTQFVRFKTSI